MRIREAALELGVKRIVVGECGHAWRVAYSFWNTLIGPFDFLDPRYPVPQHICEFTYDLIQKGALTFDKSANDDKVVTFHDSCNVARASRMGNLPGGQFVIPRAVIKAVVNKYVDMAPETTHEATFCCGGGGGLLTDDLMELRVKGALPRMQALRRVVEEHGVTHIGGDLRHLQGAVHQGPALLQVSDGHDPERPRAGEQGDPARAEQYLTVPNQTISQQVQLTGERSMATPTKQTTDAKAGLTFRRYKDGDHAWRRWQDQIFTADATDKCPTYVHKTPPCQASCPSGEDIRGWLNIVRGIEKPAKELTMAGVRLPPSDRSQPVPVGHGPRVPGAVPDRLQPQRRRGLRRHQRGGAVHRRHRAQEQIRLQGRRAVQRQESRHHRRRSGRPGGRLPVAPQGPRRDHVRRNTRSSAA